MPGRLRVLLVVVVLAFGLPCAPAHAESLDALLKRPVSPGMLGLLVVHAKDPRVGALWRESLTHPSPLVRATAARLLYASGTGGALPDLVKMLTSDTSPSAALEAARGVLSMGAGPVDEAALDAAKRLDDSRLALAVVGFRGPAAIGRLAEMRPLFGDRKLQGLISALVRDDAATLDRVADHSLRETDEKLWYYTLSFVHSSRMKLSGVRVNAALAHTSPFIRASTWWHVAVMKAASDMLDGPVRNPAEDPLEGVPPRLAFGRTLAERVITGKKGAAAALTPAQPDDPWPIPPFGMFALSTHLFDWLDVSERDVLGVKKIESAAAPPGQAVESKPSPDYPMMRTVSGLPEGYVEDVLSITRCEPKEPAVLAGASVRYNASGHLQELQWLSTPLKEGCADAARAILAAGLVPAHDSLKAGDPYLMLLPMNQPFLKCLAGLTPLKTPANSVGTNGIAPPRKTRHVNPVYPKRSYDLRRQGIVIIEATISPVGCVERIAVLRGVASDMDAEAMRAVSSWAFTPTLLHGRPVPVIMTVTVQFSLQ